MRYGTPYKGSKNFIAQWICDTLPKGQEEQWQQMTGSAKAETVQLELIAV